MTAASWLFGRLVHPVGDPEDGGISEAAQPHVARNGLRQVGAQALQGIGDQVVNAKTVLPWLLGAVAAPGVLLALLVPVRESGSMLPQAALTPWVRRLRARKWAWVGGAAAQAAATAGMALAAATTEGWLAGGLVVTALAVFALGRALCSLASKDVLGRTIPKGERGQVNGVVTVLSGVVALTLGLGLQLWGGDVGAALLAVLLAAAAACWVVGLLLFATVHEPREEVEEVPPAAGWARAAWELLRADATFRRFVWVRALLMVSALSPPFVVAMGAARDDAALTGLGLFVMAQGIANLVGGRLFGRLADESSRLLMVWCAAGASAVIVAFLLLSQVGVARDSVWLHPATYLLLAVVHLGTRLARKTYVVDVAEGDRRTEYVAVANTAMGVLLLLAGVVTGVLSVWGNEPALLLLAGLGVLGAVWGRLLPEVSAGAR